MNERLISRGIDRATGARYSLVEYDGGIGKFYALDGKNVDLVSYAYYPPQNFMDNLEDTVKLPKVLTETRKRNYPLFRRRGA